MSKPTAASRVAVPEPADAWRTAAVDDLCDALLMLRTRDEAAAFLRDVCSLHELEVLAHRWEAARLLDQGIPYARVAERVHGSTATVTRVAHWLRHGQGGYRLVLDRLARRSGG
jgi:TrpR-related protein YerC/YecD